MLLFSLDKNKRNDDKNKRNDNVAAPASQKMSRAAAIVCHTAFTIRIRLSHSFYHQD
ncbi:MAG: hypothetical protein ACR5LF_11170 [Symbiopectobacterium sp.]